MRYLAQRLLFFPGLLILAHLSCGTSALHAQRGPQLEITVLAAEDGRSLAGAQVLVDGADAGVTTNERGLLVVPGVRSGTWTVEVRLLGFLPWSRSIEVGGGGVTVVAVELEVDPIGLDPVEVEARPSVLKSRGFYDRRKGGVGSFFTREDIEKIGPRYLSDLLRRAGGIQVGSDSRGMPPARIRGQQTIVGSCPIQFFVDGVPTFAYNIDEMRPGDVEGMELYRGAASIPAEFKRGTASCGVIVLWTKVY